MCFIIESLIMFTHNAKLLSVSFLPENKVATPGFTYWNQDISVPHWPKVINHCCHRFRILNVMSLSNQTRSNQISNHIGILRELIVMAWPLQPLLTRQASFLQWQSSSNQYYILDNTEHVFIGSHLISSFIEKQHSKGFKDIHMMQIINIRRYNIML